MLNRIRLLHFALLIIACLLTLNLVVSRPSRVHAAAPTEYKQILVNTDDVQATLISYAKQQWEFVQLYRTGNLGTNQVYLILKK
jgi:hypothetical protein